MKTMPSFYHAHIYFDLENHPSAEALRRGLAEEFAGRVRIHGLIDEPIGPHPLPMFETDIPSSELSAVKSWLEKHHGRHSVLIHPLTGDELADHQDFPQWIGPALPLDLDFLRKLSG